MVSSFASSNNDNIQSGSSYVTDPVLLAKKKKEATIEKLKAEQEARAKSLFERLQEQRKVYANAKKDYYSAKSENLECKHKAERYVGLEFVHRRNQEKYEESTELVKDTKSTRNEELYRLERYTDSYCAAERMAMMVSIFAG